MYTNARGSGTLLSSDKTSRKSSKKINKMCQNCLSPEFKNIFNRHLGRTFHKHWKRLAVDILSVTAAVKPSFLVDYGEARNPEQWSCVLQELYDKGLVNAELDVLVDNGTDILIIQRYLLSRLGQVLREMPPQIVDISVADQLSTPKLLTPRERDQVVREIVTELAERYNGPKCTNQKGSEIISLCLSERINGATLYGILLGYPVVYWYQLTDGATSENCLAMQPLCVNKLSVSLACNHKREETRCVTCTEPSAADSPTGVIYSFSYPQEMDSMMQTCMTAWLGQIENHLSKQNIFADSQLFKECTTLPVVAL